MKRTTLFKQLFKKESLEYGELVLKILALILAGYWTWYIFKYQYVILPSSEPTSLNIKTDIEKIATQGGRLF